MRLSATWKGWIAAGTLAALVLFVFGTLQNFGPESAVRRFHEAVLTRNATELQEVVLQPADPKKVGRLVRSLQQLFAAGARIRLRVRPEDRSPNVVPVTVLYRSITGAQAAYTWVARRTPVGWKVDTDATLAWARFR